MHINLKLRMNLSKRTSAIPNLRKKQVEKKMDIANTDLAIEGFPEYKIRNTSSGAI